MQQFVEETIKAVMLGIKASQRHASEAGGKVVPSNMFYHEVPGLIWDKDHMLVDRIEFDVAVTVSEGDSLEGNAGIKVWGLGAGVKGKEDNKNETVSKVKFNVPVVYPKQD